ncbi:MAG: Rne/Rng family ribonuclease [Bacteroidetes bacterium]|nr:MAG: Rne/Rng family ribonuclease [Bacteroidota bacterium]
MSKEIIINSDQKQTRIAIVENGRLAELFIETKEVERTIGNLFLGRIRRIMPSIQAAFVDIGQKQDAFLHFSDLVDNIPDWLKFVQEKEPRISLFKAEFARQPIKGRRNGSRGASSKTSEKNDNSDYDIETIEDQKSTRGTRSTDEINPTNYLKRDAPILVRISKEPISSKGSRITTDISLAGRFLVLVPLAGYVAVSKKIVSFKERRRLKALAKSLVPEGFGVIVRTVAEGQNAKALDTDLRLLIQKWQKVEERLAEKPEIPCEIHQDVNMASSIIRDFFSEDFDRIVIDNDRLYRNIKGYIQAVAPKMAPRVFAHKDSIPLFELTKIEKAVEQAFSSRVDMPSGGYLFIEQTEAMHVVDVNSGRAGRGLSQEENSVRVNLEAATLIAEQVRLRDLGGILVVDFIDMRQQKNRRKVYDHLRREFRKDRAVTKVLQMSDFGLIQITRQRLRPSLNASFSMDSVSTKDAAPRIKGKLSTAERAVYETVEPADLIRKIDDWLDGMREAKRRGPVKLVVHPFTGAFLTKGFPSQIFKWFLKRRIRVTVELDDHVDPLSFRFVDLTSGQTISRRPGGSDNGKKKDSSRSRRRDGDRNRKSYGRDGGKRRSSSDEKKERTSSTRSGESRSNKNSRNRSGNSGGTTRSGQTRSESRAGQSRDTRGKDGRSRRTSERGGTVQDERTQGGRTQSRRRENSASDASPENTRSESTRNRSSQSRRSGSDSRRESNRTDSKQVDVEQGVENPNENRADISFVAVDSTETRRPVEKPRDLGPEGDRDTSDSSSMPVENDTSSDSAPAVPATEPSVAPVEIDRVPEKSTPSSEIKLDKQVEKKPKGYVYNIDLRSGKGNL